MKHTDIIRKLNLEQKCALLSGETVFTTRALPGKGIPSITLSDGPNGVRKQAGAADHLGLNPSVPATCFPTSSATACSWDEALGEAVGEALGEEAAAQEVAVLLGPGLNILTGETGAGKAILIDSINAILGNRASKDLVRTGAAKAVIRAAFEDVPPAVLDSLEKAGYERSEALLLSREITAEGKSTCRINGMPATAAVLRELCGGLININGQHDSVGLLNPARHEGILDAYAQNSAEYHAY